jgi:hypothetical protein
MAQKREQAEVDLPMPSLLFQHFQEMDRMDGVPPTAYAALPYYAVDV